MFLSYTQVNYKWTDNAYQAKQWLNNLPELFAADFEVASKYNKKQKDLFRYRLNSNLVNKEEQRRLNQKIETNGLSHPSLTFITHLSVAWSDKDAFVIVTNTPKLRNLVLNFLVTTTKVQLWHNCIFDFKHIYFNTNRIPESYIDTQLLAKSLLNNADSTQDLTSLKQLMSYAYGDWAISKDEFILEEMYNENTIKYAATDACATYKLYEDIIKDTKDD